MKNKKNTFCKSTRTKNAFKLIAMLAIFCLSNDITAQQIAGGTNHSLALCSDGTVNAWGLGTNGQLGNGNNTTNNNAPIPVLSLTGITDIQGGVHFSLALKNNGTVWAWGKNTDGQLGNGNNTDSNIPVQVSSLTGVIAIAAGFYHSLALKSDGSVWTWGENDFGQLGNGTSISSNIPVQISGVSTAIAIAVGSGHSLILKSNGTVWALGRNFSGQLGNGTTNISQVLVPVSNLTGVIAIAGAAEYSLGLKNDGTVWAWGNNNYGQHGNGVTGGSSNVPLQATGITGVIAIEAGWYQSVALKNDGTVFTWGRNDYGQLGNGTLTNSNLPVQVSSLTGVSAIETGWSHCLALKSDGSVRGWGRNDYGQLGNGTYTNSKVPVQVTGLCSNTTGVEENLIGNLISVYPNPSNDFITIENKSGQLISPYVIINCLGQQIVTGKLTSEKTSIDISGLQEGFYLLQVGEEKKQSFKLIKK